MIWINRYQSGLQKTFLKKQNKTPQDEHELREENATLETNVHQECKILMVLYPPAEHLTWPLEREMCCYTVSPQEGTLELLCSWKGICALGLSSAGLAWGLNPLGMGDPHH